MNTTWLVAVVLDPHQAGRFQALVAALEQEGLVYVSRATPDGGLRLALRWPGEGDPEAWARGVARTLAESGLKTAAMPLAVAELAIG
jgi:hypothetical protein